MSENPVKAATGFAKAHMIAFALIVLVGMIVAVAVEARKPGTISGKVAKIPFIGPRLVGAKV